MGVNFELSVKADYLAGIIRKNCGGDLPLVMYHDQSYSMLMNDYKAAEIMLKPHKKRIEADIKKGFCSANGFFDK